MNRVLLSSKKHDWGTQQAFFDRLHAEFGFTLDAAATEDNAKCHRYISPPSKIWMPSARNIACNGLVANWAPNVTWVNPPYGRAIPKWVDKAAREGRRTTVVMLVPARPDTRWWQAAVNTCHEVRFVVGRIKFEGADQGAAFPSAVLVWRGHRASCGPPVYSYMKARP